MFNMRIIKYVIFLGGLLFLYFSCSAKVKNDSPLVWDISSLVQMKSGLGNNQEANVILKKADGYCEVAPVVITDIKNNFISDNHYYFSMAPYRWPNPLGTGNYIWKDGQVNPESRLYGSAKLEEMKNRCQFLSKAFFLTEDEKYYYAFIKQLKAWFFDENTYMYPSFEYAQVIPGENNNKGNIAGQIESYSFNSIIESIRLVNGTKKINRQTMTGLQKWFLAFIEESESRCGAVYSKSNSNIALAYDVTLINMYLFSDKEGKAKALAEKFAKQRINKQILEDGRQPEELKRTNAFSYSIFNLTHILDFCFLMRFWDKDYYNKNGERIEKAFDYLQKVVDNQEVFSYKQNSGWDSAREMLNNQSQRRNALKNNYE